MNFYHRSKPGRKKILRDDDKCLVCGGKSIGLNFGVQTCSPCKAFFRRNAVKLGTYEFRCSGDGDCPVTSDTRQQCNCCRLAKCFRVGMDRKAIRTEDERAERTRLIEYNRQKRTERQQLMIRSSNLSNYKCVSLSFNDQTLLTNIMSAYDQTCISLSYRQHSRNVDDSTLSMEKFMNSLSHMYMALIEYFKFVPEFSNLPIYFKKFILKNNLNQVFRLNNALVIKSTGLADDPSSLLIIRLFPHDLFLELTKCTIGIFPYLFDPILLKLFLIVLIFSTHLNIRYENNNDNENNSLTLQIYHIQNIYVELLWRYLLYRCSNLRQAIQLFSSFITRLIYSQYINIKLNEFISNLTSNQTDQLEPIMKVMWINDEK